MMDMLMTALTDRQDADAAILASSRKKQERPTPINLSLTSCQGGLQMSIEVGIEKGKTMDVGKSNNALLEMAIADFFHCENLPDRDVESNCFHKILDFAKVVGSGFTIPSRKKVGGELFFLAYYFET